MTKQRLLGLVLLLVCALVIALANHGETVEDRDASPVLFLGPLGIYMMATRRYVLYDEDADDLDADVPPHDVSIRAEYDTPAQEPRRARSREHSQIERGEQTWQENAS